MIVALKKNRDFQKVYRTGKSYGNRCLVMYVIQNHLDSDRIGISVSKKVGNSVVRHRIKRLIRESYRLHQNELETGYDIVVVARAAARDKSMREIESAFLHLTGLHKLIKMVAE